MGSRRAAFFDKDGTLIIDVPYNVDPARIELFPDALSALRRLADAGYLIVVVTNQRGASLGLFPESALESIEARLRELLLAGGIELSGFYYCPHSPDAGCPCRKPKPGLLERAARDLDISLRDSWMVGDKPTDVAAGHAAGCRAVLIAEPEIPTLTAAVDFILS